MRPQLLALLGLCVPASAFADPLPDAGLVLTVTPSAQSDAWVYKLQNKGASPMRVPVHVGLLSLDAEVPSTKPKAKPEKVHCAAPATLRPSLVPESRLLVLAPGEIYEEGFDVRLLCFGKAQRALSGGASLHATYGWDLAPKWSKKSPQAPFVAQSLAKPDAFVPLKQVVSASWTASSETTKPTQESASVPAANEDANAPAITLHADSSIDALSPRGIVLHLNVTNAGARPMILTLRNRMVSLAVLRPDGATVRCPATPASEAIPRDMFRELKAGASTSLAVVASEICREGTFDRPGLYSIATSIEPNERGDAFHLEAFTGEATAPEMTWVRLGQGTEPFYESPPQPVAKVF